MPSPVEVIVAKVVVGEYVTIIKPGTFGKFEVKAGQAARVVGIARGSGSRCMSNKTYAVVDVCGKAGNTIARIELPSWWLRPRSILDDIVEATNEK